jgi:hypothetical protein
VAGDVMTTATAGAEGAARIGESADRAQQDGPGRGETDQVTATGPQPGVPDNLQVPALPGETPPSTSEGETPREPGRAARPTRQTRQGPAPAAAWRRLEQSGGPV